VCGGESREDDAADLALDGQPRDVSLSQVRQKPIRGPHLFDQKRKKYAEKGCHNRGV